MAQQRETEPYELDKIKMGGRFVIRAYGPELRREWDSFVDVSRNGTFLFRRGYMDYHSDRFTDSSFMAYKGNRLVAMLPADISGSELHSHRGLTYGGWILPKRHLDGADFLELWQAWLDHCRDNGIERIFYKPVPYIYHRQPSQEDLYALFRSGAVCMETNLSSAIDLADNPGFNMLMRRHLKKSLSSDVRIEEQQDVEAFMSMTCECLQSRHGAKPVHTVLELQQLKDRFPENIRIFILYSDADPLAGVCLYVDCMTVHCQYISTTERGRRENMLPLLFHYLITDLFCKYRYFDFGTSNEDGGRILNGGLLRQKFSMGGTGVAYSKFMMDLSATRSLL